MIQTLRTQGLERPKAEHAVDFSLFLLFSKLNSPFLKWLWGTVLGLLASLVLQPIWHNPLKTVSTRGQLWDRVVLAYLCNPIQCNSTWKKKEVLYKFVLANESFKNAFLSFFLVICMLVYLWDVVLYSICIYLWDFCLIVSKFNDFTSSVILAL